MNKRNFIYILLGLLFIPLSVFGFEKSDITMVSYTQSWKDKEGTLVVKNNTSAKIGHIVFWIYYSDSIGNIIKRDRFSENIFIKPYGNTTIKIPALEAGKYGGQFKIQDRYGRVVLKVGFELIEYNNNSLKKAMEQTLIIILVCIGGLLILTVWYICYDN